VWFRYVSLGYIWLLMHIYQLPLLVSAAVLVLCDDLRAFLFFAAGAVEAEVVVPELDLRAVDDPGLVGAAVARPHDQLGAVVDAALDVDHEVRQGGLDGAVRLQREDLRRRAVEGPEVQVVALVRAAVHHVQEQPAVRMLDLDLPADYWLHSICCFFPTCRSTCKLRMVHLCPCRQLIKYQNYMPSISMSISTFAFHLIPNIFFHGP